MSAARTRRNWTWTAAAFTVAALLAFGGILAPAPGARANAYPDVAGQPAEIQQAIDYVTSRGYMNGGADGGFHPNDPIGRLDYACTLVRFFKNTGEAADPTITFKDLPASDPGYEGASSQDLLAMVVRTVRQAGYRVVNVDSTVIAEEPRLQPHIDAIRKQLAKTLDIDLGAVSVKATSPEGLGALGREEGIAAHAVALIEATG